MKMNQKWINYVMMVGLVLQVIISTLTDSAVFEPTIQKWILVVFTGLLIVANGLVNYSKQWTSLVIMNVVLFVGYLGGALVEIVDMIPNLGDEGRAYILTVLGLMSTISNTIARSKGWLLAPKEPLIKEVKK